jgi:competence protein ComGC
MKKRRGLTKLEVALILGVCAVVVSMIFPNFVRARSRGSLTACKSNLKNIGTALEMYSTDWGARYPPSVALLTPNYLKTMPICPDASEDTYSRSYSRLKMPAKSFVCSDHEWNDDLACDEKRQKLYKSLEDIDEYRDSDQVLSLTCPGGKPYKLVTYWETYKLFCMGEHHTRVSLPPNYPQYDGISGLIER